MSKARAANLTKLAAFGVWVRGDTVHQAHAAEPEVCAVDALERYFLITTYGSGDEVYCETADSIAAVEASIEGQLDDEYPWMPAQVLDLDAGVELAWELKAVVKAAEECKG